MGLLRGHIGDVHASRSRSGAAFPTSRHNLYRRQAKLRPCGPLLVTRFANSEDEDSWRGRLQQYAFEPVSTSALPRTFSEFLADEQYAYYEYQYQLILKSELLAGR